MDTLTIIIAGGILLVAIVIAFIFANRQNWRILKSSPAVEVESEEDSTTAVDHYTEMRDKLTLKDAGVEEEEVEEESSSGSGFSFMGIIGTIIGMGVMLMVGMTVINTVKTALPPEQMNESIMGMGGVTMGTMIGWLPMMIVVPAIIFVFLSVMGGFNSSDNSSSSTTTKKKRKRGVKHYTSMRDKLSEK